MFTRSFTHRYYLIIVFSQYVEAVYFNSTITLLKLTNQLFLQIPGNVEFHPKYIIYGKKQHLFLIVYEFSGATNEVVLYWENTDTQLANSKGTTIKGFHRLSELLVLAS